MQEQARTPQHLALVVLALLGAMLAACASTETDRDEVSEARAPLLASAQLVLESITGEAFDLNTVLAEGRPVVFVFWQTWCESCLAEAPRVGAAARELSGHAQFVGVVPGPSERVDDAKVLSIAAEKRLEFPQVRDRDMALTRAFDVTGTPTIVVLRPDGTTGYVGHGLPASLGELR